MWSAFFPRFANDGHGFCVCGLYEDGWREHSSRVLCRWEYTEKIYSLLSLYVVSMWHMLTMAKWLHCSIAAHNLHRKFTTKLIQSDLFISCHINISTGNGNREQFDYSLLGGFSRILDCCCCSSSSIYGFGYLLLFVYVAFLGVLLS